MYVEIAVRVSAGPQETEAHFIHGFGPVHWVRRNCISESASIVLINFSLNITLGYPLIFRHAHCGLK